MKRTSKNKSSVFFIVLAVLLIVVGILVIVYPKITDFIYHNSAEKAMSEFTAESKQTDTDRLYELLKQKNGIHISKILLTNPSLSSRIWLG